MGRTSCTWSPRIVAGNTSAPLIVTFTLDTRSPEISLVAPDVGADLGTGPSVSGTADGTGSPVTALAYHIDGGDLDAARRSTRTRERFSGTLDLSRLAAGSHTVVVTARDAAGNTASLSRDVSSSPARIPLTAMVTPDDGAQDVGVTFRPQVVFSRPVDTSTLTSSSFFATGPGGAAFPATIVPAADGTSAWLFFAGRSARRRGDHAAPRRLAHPRPADGQLLDGDEDGTPGGMLTATFTTVSLAPLLGTSLSGRLLDPGPDLKPMTFDDIRPGPDGALHTADDVFLSPIAGVQVFIIGLESQAVFTDAAGRFHFDAVPAGDVKVKLDGTTATNAPAGFYFPEMVMDATIQAGRANTVMGSMGTLEEQTANADREEVYLPRLRTSILQAVSATEPTADRPRSGVGARPHAGAAAAAHDHRAAGQPDRPRRAAAGRGQVGISMVPPELVRDMLPPGVLQHTFDITIQAPGVDASPRPWP